MENQTDSQIIEAHVPCPDCGSSDAMCVYDDGHTYCFSCEAHHQNHEPAKTDKPMTKGNVVSPADLNLGALPARGISQETCKLYGYYKGFRHVKPAQFANYSDETGTIIGQKIRYPDKTFETIGNLQHRFFGQHLFAGGKKLIITEGEIDCLTVSQIQGNKYPVVSVPNGAKSAKKTFEAQYDWLEGFDEVIVMFDMDKVGREAVESVCGILRPGKLKIATLPLKDPNDCLMQGQAAAVVNAIWNAKTYKPACIINGAELWETLSTEQEDIQGYPLPWKIDLQKMTMGLRKGELILITAGTGTGKTTFVRQLAHHYGINLGLKIGMLMLEENVKRTAKGLMAIHTGKRLALNRHLITEEEYKNAFDATLGSGHFIFYEHFGSLESEDLIKNILELMEDIRAKKNTGILMITHDLGVVAEMCSRVVVMYAGRIVEEAPVQELFADPKHPYTQGLIGSVPKLGSGVESLPSIPGSVPDLSVMPKGCKFAPRCKYAMDICHQQEPELADINEAGTRKCRCHLLNKTGKEA